MSIIEDEAGSYWNGSRDCSEWSYFELGFDKAIELVGTCFQCEYRNTKECPLLDAISEVDLYTYYCASYSESN